MVIPNLKSKVIEFPIGEALINTYKLRQSIPGRKAVEVSVPRDFVRTLAMRAGMTYEEFTSNCEVFVYFSGGNILLYEFRLKDEQGEGESE